MSTGLSLVLKLRTRHCPSAPPVLCYSPRDCLQAHSIQLTVFRNKYLALARKCNNSLERNRNLSLNSLSMHKGPAAPEDGRTLSWSLHSESQKRLQWTAYKKRAPEIHSKQGYTAQFVYKFKAIKS